MDELGNKARSINTKEDFLDFLRLLIHDLKNSPDSWENVRLDSYLEAAAAWTEDMEGYYMNNKLPVPENVNWQVFADILMAAAIYE